MPQGAPHPVGGRSRTPSATPRRYAEAPAGTDDKARHALRLRQCTAAVLLEWRWAEQVAGKLGQSAPRKNYSIDTARRRSLNQAIWTGKITRVTGFLWDRGR